VAPSIKVIIGSGGEVLESPKLVSLSGKDGTPHPVIVSTVDPLLKNIDIASYSLA